jgi:hypothetical protein
MGGGAGGGEACAGAGGGATSRSSSSNRSRRWRDSNRPETDTEAQELERQFRGASIRMRWPPTENEIESARADELSSVSTTRQQSRFIGASAGLCQH